jgi:hypothetical protein
MMRTERIVKKYTSKHHSGFMKKIWTKIQKRIEKTQRAVVIVARSHLIMMLLFSLQDYLEWRA